MDSIASMLAAPEAMVAQRSERELAVARVELLNLLLADALERLDGGEGTLDGGQAAYVIARRVREAIERTAP